MKLSESRMDIDFVIQSIDDEIAVLTTARTALATYRALKSAPAPNASARTHVHAGHKAGRKASPETRARMVEAQRKRRAASEK